MFVIYEGGTLNVHYDVSGADGKLYLDGGSNGFKKGNTEVNYSEPVTVNAPLILMKGGTCNLGKNVRVRFNENLSTTLPGGAINMKGGTLNITDAIIEFTESVGADGGGIYATGGEINVSGTQDMWIGDCEAVNGGGVYLGGGAVMNINSSTFTLGASSLFNYVKGDGTDGDWSDWRNKVTGNGGGIYVDGGILNIDMIRIAGWNEAAKGGAIYINDGIANIKSSIDTFDTENGKNLRTGHFFRNMAKDGGAIYVAQNGVLNFESGYIEESGLSDRPDADGLMPVNGSAIYIEKGGVATLSGGSIVNCEGKLRGGAIYIENGGILNLSGDCTINNNKVAEKKEGGLETLLLRRHIREQV